MSNSSLPIKLSTGRRLVIEEVTDTAAFSARRLSFNAKEIQYLCEELAKWLSEMYEEEVDADLSKSLNSGVVLLSIVEKYMPQIKLRRWHPDAAPISFKARDNIGVFADVCVELGMRRSDVCNYSHFEKGDLKQIAATLCAFAKLGIPKGLNKVSEDLKAFVDNAYSPPVKEMETVEEEIKLSEEELAQIEIEKQMALERQQRIEELTKHIEEDKTAFMNAYDSAVSILCEDIGEGIDLNLDLDLDLELDSSTPVAEPEPEVKKESCPPEVTAESLHAQIENAKREKEIAERTLKSVNKKKSLLIDEGSDVSEINAIEMEMTQKLENLNQLILDEEKKEERLLREEEEKRLEAERKRIEEEEAERRRLEEEEAERKRQEEEAERKRIEEEEAERKRQEEEAERKRQEEEAERKRQEEEAERIRKEEEEAERKRQEEEAERKRQEEEAERKRQEEEAERKRQEEEAQRELERQAEEEERLRREEEEALAKKKCGCRNKRPKEEEVEEEAEEETEVTEETESA